MNSSDISCDTTCCCNFPIVRLTSHQGSTFYCCKPEMMLKTTTFATGAQSRCGRLTAWPEPLQLRFEERQQQCSNCNSSQGQNL